MDLIRATAIIAALDRPLPPSNRLHRILLGQARARVWEAVEEETERLRERVERSKAREEVTHA